MTIIVLGPAVSGTDWEEARSKVRADLWRATLPVDQIDRALHTALLELEAERRWLWLENIVATLTMPSQAATLDIPSVKSITSLALTRNPNDYDLLDQRPLSWVRAQALGSAAGFPTYYAITNGNTVYFDCLVPVATTFEAIVTSTCPRDLATAIALPPVTLARETPAIVALACSHLSLTFTKNEAEAARQRAAYERILDRLFVEEDTARADANVGGCIQPDDVYQSAAHGNPYG